MAAVGQGSQGDEHLGGQRRTMGQGREQPIRHRQQQAALQQRLQGQESRIVQ
jgi:hypothetical protein